MFSSSNTSNLIPVNPLSRIVPQCSRARCCCIWWCVVHGWQDGIFHLDFLNRYNKIDKETQMRHQEIMIDLKGTKTTNFGRK